MKKSNRILLIIAIVVIIVLIAIGIYMATKKDQPVIVPPNINTPTGTDYFQIVSSFFSKLFGKKTLPPYVQVPPIDADGCDANGLNAVGINCSIGGF